MCVRKYGITKYLSFSKSSSKTNVDDICEVCEEDDCEVDESCGKTVQGDITAVIAASEYTSCKFCHSKVCTNDGIVGQCSKCQAFIKISVCEKSKSAKVVITDVKGTVSILEPILSRIVSGISGDNLSVKLLTAPQFVFTVNTKDVAFLSSK